MMGVASVPMMMAALGCLLLAPFEVLACAGCRNPNMPVTRVNGVQLRPGELRAGLSLGAELQVPFRLVRTSIKYVTPQGYPYQPLDPDVHHRDETLLGVGDLWLLGRWVVSGYGQGQAALYENVHGYQAGIRGSLGAQAGRKVWRSLTGAVGLEALYEGPERWDGQIRQDGNLGRTEALAVLSLVQASPKTSLGLSGRVPVYQHIVSGDEKPGTISSPLMVGLSVGRTLSVF